MMTKTHNYKSILIISYCTKFYLTNIFEHSVDSLKN